MTPAPRLLVLDAAYSIATVRERNLEHSIQSRDLGGFFDHVWSVHPLAGADPEDLSTSIGPIVSETLDARNTFIEARIGRYGWLRRLPIVNLFIAQAGLLIYLWRLVRVMRITLIRVGDPYYLGLFGLALARLNRIPLVIRINGNYDLIYEETGRAAYPRLLGSRDFEKRIERFVLPRADLVAGANQDNLEYAVTNGARRERGTVFRYGNLIAPVHFADPSGRVSIRQELGIGDVPLIVCVGRLEELKHVDDVVVAFGTVARAHATARLLFVGDGSQRNRLVQLGSQLGVEDRMHLVGNRDQGWIARALADADVVASPRTGRALVEAGLSGSVIVAYDVEWHSELITNAITGWLVPYRDVAGFAAAMARCLAHPGEASALGAQGREHVRKVMDPILLMQHERGTYAELLGMSSGSLETE
jgi:glycosyltransferase involved in cell wall biosynthesis